MPRRLPPFPGHTLATQQAFARLSGDANPVHLDPSAARRTVFGAVAVHGMHNVLVALEALAADGRARGTAPPAVARLAVRFLQPVFLDEPVDMAVDDDGPGPLSLTMTCGGVEVMALRLVASDGAEPAAVDLAPSAIDLARPAGPGAPVERAMADLDGREGEVPLSGDAAAIAGAFPGAVAMLGLDGVARLLGLTRLVGMECPGLHSMFVGFDVRFDGPRDGAPTHYRVVQADARVSMVNMTVEGGGMRGTVNAFLRPPPVAQPAMAAVAAAVDPGAFAGQRALVVGGSRGLGETAAKIMAAGGADVVLTYRSGKADAERVAAEISAAGGSARAAALDAVDPGPAVAALAAAGWRADRLLYFATPRITTRKRAGFDDALFARFKAVYVDGPRALVAACRAHGGGPLALFVPSSVAVDGEMPDLPEYTAAKQAGEDACRALADADADLALTIERLPPLATDQTASLLAVAAGDPLAALVAALGAGRSGE